MNLFLVLWKSTKIAWVTLELELELIMLLEVCQLSHLLQIRAVLTIEKHDMWQCFDTEWLFVFVKKIVTKVLSKNVWHLC